MIIQIQYFKDAEDDLDCEAQTRDYVFHLTSVNDARAALNDLEKIIAKQKPYDGSDEAYEDKVDRELNPFNK